MDERPARGRARVLPRTGTRTASALRLDGRRHRPLAAPGHRQIRRRQVRSARSAGVRGTPGPARSHGIVVASAADRAVTEPHAPRGARPRSQRGRHRCGTRPAVPGRGALRPGGGHGPVADLRSPPRSPTDRPGRPGRGAAARGCRPLPAAAPGPGGTRLPSSGRHTARPRHPFSHGTGHGARPRGDAP